MKKVLNVLLLTQLGLLLCPVLLAQKKTLKPDTTFNTFANQYSSEFFSSRYHIYTVEHFLDNYYPNAHYQIETTGNFSQPDQYVFSLTGYSYKWNKYYFDGIRMNDLSFPGASLHKPMLLDKSLDIDLVGSRLDFTTTPSDKSYIYTQWNNGSMGDMVPWTDAYSHLMHGHQSGPEKAWQPIPERKKTRNAGLVYFALPSENHNNYGYVTVGRRMITNFNFIRLDDYFGEDYLQMHYHGDINLQNRKLEYLITYNQRDNLFSEYYYGRKETAALNQLNLSVYSQRLNLGAGSNPMTVNAGLNFSHKNIEKNFPGFSRNVADQDGESLEPFYSDGKYKDLILSVNGEKQIAKNLKWNFDAYDGLVHFSPRHSGYENTLYYENNLSPFTPLYMIDWRSEAFSAGVLENTMGLEYSTASASNRTTLDIHGNVTYDAIRLNPKGISKLNYELGLNLKKKLGKRLTSTLDIGKRRVPFEMDQVRFLSDKYQSGESYYWNDANNDRSFSINEKGVLFSTTGGAYHQASEDLQQPEIYYIDYGNKWQMGRNWELTFLAQYRKFSNQWSVQYSGMPQQYGTFESNSNGSDIFYLNGNQQLHYLVVNDNKDRMEQLAQKKLGWLVDSPFYGGLTLNLEKKTRNTYVYVSATAYEVVGISPMGNGVLTNNLGVLSESLANPNTYIQNLGRLDSDRAYIVRIYYHQILSKRWKLGFQVKYKDGQPVNRNEFALKTNTNGNQFAFWNADIKGINPFTGQFGVREGGFWNYELRFQYNFTLKGLPLTADLNIYNIMDVATPLNNYNFPEPDDQWALELQIPRGMLLSLRYEF